MGKCQCHESILLDVTAPEINKENVYKEYKCENEIKDSD